MVQSLWCVYSLCLKEVLCKNKKDFPEVKDETKCTECKPCELRCPDFAIEIKEKVNV